ncbi:MAG: helix-turn-helix transcriptional regulator [Eubacteriales bacterium]|jgi:transcriptional regulator with XRE-family HTH domain|nr:helix-turn-helix transcriptional regulator [Eubacteriales bacterium]
MRTNENRENYSSRANLNVSNGMFSGAMVKADIASQILLNRVARNMSQKAFAQFMGVSQAMISKWESGDCNLSLSTICEICDKLDLVFEAKFIKANEYPIQNNPTGNFEIIRGGENIKKNGGSNIPTDADQVASAAA